MQVRLVRFGSVEVEGQEYEHDIVIEGGWVRKRRKPSMPYPMNSGKTPLSADEEFPWGGDRLIIGTGADGSPPIMPQVFEDVSRTLAVGGKTSPPSPQRTLVG